MNATPEDLSDAPTADEARKKRRALLILLGLVAFFGIADPILMEFSLDSPLWEILSGIPIVVCICVWCHYDAAQRGYTIGRALGLLILLILVVGFPVYAFRTRGWAGFRLVGWGILFFALFVAVYAVAGLVTEGVLHLIQG